MHCPACQQPLSETSEACPCGLTMAALDQLMGMAKSLSGPVADLAGALSASEAKRVRLECERLERKFPQASIAIVIGPTPPRVHLGLYAFWLLNRGGLSSAVQRGAANHTVLLCIDPDQGVAVATIGYGLEPFVSRERLNAAVQTGAQQWVRDQVAAGLLSYLARLDDELKQAALTAEHAFGKDEDLEPYEGLEQFAAGEQAQAVPY